MDAERARKIQERDHLRNLVAQWNANRLDLFALSEPNEDLEFHGVMRFYFQDAGQKVATKCIRVSSTAPAKVVITTLIEKFRPDMRMLSIPEYALYEIHENGEERKLGDEEIPLLVQLNWHKDDREGRFLLRRMDEKTYMTSQHFVEDTHFKRKLSKREKKEKKKKEKLQRLKDINDENQQQLDGIAERLYTEMPETSFTRSISNPEAVMRRRRQQKLEKKLQQFRSRDGGPDTGGTLKIYGESLCRDVPYKTLLLSIGDNAAYVVKEMLVKYALEKEEAASYCLVQTVANGDEDSKEYHGSGTNKEYILDDDECPLSILMNHPPAKGSITFQIKRRPADYQPRKRKKKPKPVRDDIDYRYEDTPERLPYFLELNPDGSEMLLGNQRMHRLHLNVTEVGSERSMSPSGQCLQLFGPNVQPRHCVIAHTEGIVTVTPSSRDAETFVNGQRIYETTILQHGMVVRFGKIHTFRFVDPMQEERRQRHGSGPGTPADYYDRQSTKDDSSIHASTFETTFDVDNNVETRSTSSLKDDRRSEKSDRSKETRSATYERFEQRPRGQDRILPAVLEFRDDGEDAFLRAVITIVDPSLVQFKLAPTYSLYMAARYRASTHYRPDISPSERAHWLTNLMGKVAAMVQHVIQEKYRDANALAFWMANASEILHFLKQDRHLSAYSLDAQDLLAEGVQVAFRSLGQCLQADIQIAMPAFLEDRDDENEEDGTTAEILELLSSAMSLLRRCRVNAALTIQLFSQLFHFINMWLFNRLVCDPRPNFCTRMWGIWLKHRLSRIELWAEKQGLELAADCHLSRIAQAAHLLQSPKSSPDDIATISSTCFKLNSLQLRALLERYQPAPDESQVPLELIENVIKVAENTADELARTDGRDIKLEEDPDLQLPFLLPEDGYSCDIVRGVPAGLQEFLQPLQLAHLCRVAIQPTSSGYWTIYMTDQDLTRNTAPRSSSSLGQHAGAVTDLSRLGKEPEITVIKLQKSNNGMGLSIVAAKGIGQDRLGIYIKSVVKGGAADADGRLQAGDQLLKVDGQSLVGITQEKAAEYMTRTGPLVTLQVAKQGAIYHGLAGLLSQPSPAMQRGFSQQSVRRLSERDLPGRVSREQGQELDPRHIPRMQSSKSVPSLASGPHPQEATRAPSSGNVKMPQEIFNPGYSRTSSTASIVKGSEPPLSRDPPTIIRPNDQNYGPEARLGRPTSQLNIPQEERFYQNISLYQQHQQEVPQHFQSHPSLTSPKSPVVHIDHAHPSQHAPLPSPRGPPPYEDHSQQMQPGPRPQYEGSFSQQPLPSPKVPSNSQYDDRFNRDLRGSQSSLHRPEVSPGIRERPLSAVVSQRERDQYLNTGIVPPGAPGDNRFSGPGYAHPVSQQHSPDPRNNDYKEPVENGSNLEGHITDEMRSVRLDHRGSVPIMGQAGQVGLDPRRSERNFIRQEAKMEEMREEVQRREERTQREMELQARASTWNGNGPPPAGFQNRPMQGYPTKPVPVFPSSGQHPLLQQHPGQSHYYQQQQHPGKPIPITPKPKLGYVQGPEKPQRHFSHEGPPPPYGSPGHDVPPERPPLPDEAHLYRDSPPPPPPPPTSTHPLVQQQQQQRLAMQNGPVNYRVRPSDPHIQPHEQYGNGPHRASLDHRHQVRQPPHSSQPVRAPEAVNKSFANALDSSSAMSPSPWEREEREKERKRRLADAWRLRDQEIQELEMLPHRSVRQDERLRTLRLEQEFQRRAEEQKNDDDDDNEEDDDINERRGLLRMVQEDMERTRLRRLEREQERQDEQLQQQLQQQHLQEQQLHNHHISNQESDRQRGQSWQPELPSSNHNSEDWLRRQQEIKNQRREQLQREEEERVKQQKLDEVRRKRELEKAAIRELQSTREAEERLLREAQRRQEEDLKAQQRAIQQQHHYQQQHMQQQQSRYHQGGGYGPHHGPQQAASHHGPQQAASTYPLQQPMSPITSGPAQRLDNLLMTSVSQPQFSRPTSVPSIQQQSDHKHDPDDNMRAIQLQHRSNAVPPKRVSFHDATVEVASDNENEDDDVEQNSQNNQQQMQEYIEESIFMTSPNSQQATMFSTGPSPGVIGAQEVYRDPRRKIEAQRMMQTQTGSAKQPGPEKLSFKEKMKMFALETGQEESPRDKVKISRAQRDIEINLNGTVKPA